MGYTGLRKMGQPKAFTPVRLICGVIYKEDALYENVKHRLVAERGGVDMESTAFPFGRARGKAVSPPIALGQAISPLLEFLFTKTGIKVLDWTYPDFRRAPCQEIFRSVRDTYLRRLRERPT